MSELRRCEIESYLHLNTGKSEKQIGLFHKWFDGINEFNDSPEQFAIIEFEDGFTRQISIKKYRIRFFSYEENNKYFLDQLSESIKKSVNEH